MKLLVLGVLFLQTAWGADMIAIPEGAFQMPALLDRTPRKVSAFHMDKYPVTNAEYLEFLKTRPEWRKSQAKRIFADKNYLEYWKDDLSFGGAGAMAPVVQVSWYAARAYCDVRGKRLPTVDEWEYAGQMPLKDGRDPKTVILEWYGKSVEGALPSVTNGAPNARGVHGLHGLVWEWVEDFNSSMVTGESRADTALNRNMFCGGGAASAADPSDYAAFMRFAFRSSLQAQYTVRSLGFRCVEDRE